MYVRILVYFSAIFPVCWGGGGMFAHVMHGRSRLTVDPCIPAAPVRTRRAFTDQAHIVGLTGFWGRWYHTTTPEIGICTMRGVPIPEKGTNT